MIIDNRYYRIKSIFGYRLRALLEGVYEYLVWSAWKQLFVTFILLTKFSWQSEGEDDNELIQLELDLPSFDRSNCAKILLAQYFTQLVYIYKYSSRYFQCILATFQSSLTGFALQLLGQSLEFQSWSNEEKYETKISDNDGYQIVCYTSEGIPLPLSH